MVFVHFPFDVNDVAKSITIAYPYPVCIYGFYMHTCDFQYGDKLDVECQIPNAVGYCTQDAQAGGYTVNVSDNVVANAVAGFCLVVGGTDVGCITNVDKINKTITIDTPLTAVIPAYTPLNFHLDLVTL
jgi:hypothetical protein